MKKRWSSVAAAVALIAVLAACAAQDKSVTDDTIPVQNAASDTTTEQTLPVSDIKPVSSADFAIATAVYPEMAQYPDETEYFDVLTGEWDSEAFSEAYGAWRTDKIARRNQPEGYADAMEGFLTASLRQFLSGSDGQNRVYSPLNVYLALGMLSELTGGESRQQILDLLGCEDIEAVRAQASSVWNANYCSDGAVTSILASSLWLNEQIDYNADTMDTLAETYYASSYQGQMGSEELNQAFRSWLNEQTGGLLSEQIDGIELEPETVLALAATIRYQAKWSTEFAESRTEDGTFFAASGEVICEFMNKTDTTNYYWGEQFSAVGLPLRESGAMWLILPDEGVSPEALLEDEQAMRFLLADGDWENRRFMTVNLSIPKFDVSSQTDLRDGLYALGVTDVFDPAVSDFTPTAQTLDGIFLAKALHGARVLIDEEGCTAAAYTVMAEAGSAMPPDEEVDFVLDRPFLFVITGADGLPLFAGVVNRPE